LPTDLFFWGEQTSDIVTVNILRAVADHIQEQPWFKVAYRDLQDFVDDAVRRLKEKYDTMMV